MPPHLYVLLRAAAAGELDLDLQGVNSYAHAGRRWPDCADIDDDVGFEEVLDSRKKWGFSSETQREIVRITCAVLSLGICKFVLNIVHLVSADGELLKCASEQMRFASEQFLMGQHGRHHAVFSAGLVGCRGEQQPFHGGGAAPCSD